MAWVAVGMAAVGVAGSIASSSASNKSNAAAFVANSEQVKKDFDYQIKQFQQQAKDANDNIALDMSAKRWDALKSTASTSNVLVERNIAGNTATREYNQSKLNAMFAHNTLAKKAEDTMASFGYTMNNAEVEANNAIYSAGAMAKKANISTLQAGTSAVQAGMAGYSMGSSLGGTSLPASGTAGEGFGMNGGSFVGAGV